MDDVCADRSGELYRCFKGGRASQLHGSRHLSRNGKRRKEAERAEAIIASEVERFEARLHTLDVVPTIVSLQDHLETIRQAEIDRVRGRMGQLTPEQEMAVEALTRGIINKVMHTPITTLKTAARESEATTVVDVVRRLFNLQVKEGPVAKKDEVGTRQ